MDNKIFEEYINSYSASLTRLCVLLCSDKICPDDLYQETWLKAMRFYDKYKPYQSFDKWLYRICINTYKDLCKSSDYRKRIHFNTIEEHENFISSIPDKEHSHEKYMELMGYIKELPEKYRTVISLRYFNDYSEKDTAKILKIPVGTVKSRLNKAKEIIRRRFEE
ncbi:MAG: RNA polymerase sigma factor [Oscillospiraceae bacterium]